MSRRHAALALAVLATLGACHRSSTRIVSGEGPARLSDEERMAITMALHYVVQSPPAAGRPICLGSGYGMRDSSVMRRLAHMVRATVPPPAAEAPDLACGGAWRTAGAPDSSALALRIRRLTVRDLEYTVSVSAWDAHSTLSGYEVLMHLDFDEFQLVKLRPIYQ